MLVRTMGEHERAAAAWRPDTQKSDKGVGIVTLSLYVPKISQVKFSTVV